MTPVEMRRFLKRIGMTAADLRHFRDVAARCQQLGEDRVVSLARVQPAPNQPPAGPGARRIV